MRRFTARRVIASVTAAFTLAFSAVAFGALDNMNAGQGDWPFRFRASQTIDVSVQGD
jgi:hypothetical protein